MRKEWMVACLLCVSSAHALTTEQFKENGEVGISLSDSNTNRLVVRGDKITRAHFPEGALGIQNESDGSLYVTCAYEKPFTLFITTEGGSHFSATVIPKDTLGQTVEFLAEQAKPQVMTKRPVKVQPYTDVIQELMTHLVLGEPLEGFKVKRERDKGVHFQSGLTVRSKRVYQGVQFKGEILALHNTGKMPLTLQESWFSNQQVKAVALSSTTLAPKARAWVYRVSSNG